MSARERSILIIPTWYPTVANPLQGSFLREQAQLLAGSANVRVLVPLAQSTRGYWRGKVDEGSSPMQGPPAFVARARCSRFLTWRGRIDAQVAAVERSFGGFRREGWVPDVILAHTTAWAGVISTLFARRIGLPVVIVEHSGFYQYSPEQQDLIRQSLGEAAIVGAVSPSLRRGMLALDLQDSIEWAILGNLVDESVFCVGRSRRGESPAVRRILIVASRSYRKDVRTFFRAASIIRKSRPRLDFEILAVGDSAVGDAMTFAEAASECGVRGLMRTVNHLERDEMAMAMRSSDLLVSSSISETFGLAVAEALACGTPVVATRSGGAEYVLGEDSPFLVEVRDPEELARRILQVLDGDLPFDPIRASTDVARRFGREAYGTRLTALLEKAVDELSPCSNPAACSTRGPSGWLASAP